MKIKQTGVSLIEVMLVIVIIGAMLMMGGQLYHQRLILQRGDYLATQVQQILNAATAYYVANGAWPPAPNSSIACLQGDKTKGHACIAYLPTPMINPVGANFYIGSSGDHFWVSANVGSSTNSKDSFSIATRAAAKLPLSDAYDVSGNGQLCAPGNPCMLHAAINIPKQSLSDASAINFAGLYHHGACVPAPLCPVDDNGNPMTPQIIAMPVQVSGVNDDGTNNVYPISSFTAYATGKSSGGPSGYPASPEPCLGSGPNGTVACWGNAYPVTGNAEYYWRVCMQIVTEKGNVQSTRTDFAWRNDGWPYMAPYFAASGWGASVTIAVFTRCAPANEISGTRFDYTDPANPSGPKLQIFGK